MPGKGIAGVMGSVCDLDWGRREFSFVIFVVVDVEGEGRG